MLVQAQLLKSPTVMYTPVAPTKTAEGITGAASLHALNGAFVTTGMLKSHISYIYKMT